MTYEPLPAMLKVGDKIACSKHYIEAEVLEVFKVDGDRVYLMRENGVCFPGEFFMRTLQDYDYKLIVE